MFECVWCITYWLQYFLIWIPIFKKIDSSGDGRLTYDELEKGFSEYYKGSALSKEEFGFRKEVSITRRKKKIKYQFLWKIEKVTRSGISIKN